MTQSHFFVYHRGNQDRAPHLKCDPHETSGVPGWGRGQFPKKTHYLQAQMSRAEICKVFLE